MSRRKTRTLNRKTLQMERRRTKRRIRRQRTEPAELRDTIAAIAAISCHSYTTCRTEVGFGMFLARKNQTIKKRMMMTKRKMMTKKMKRTPRRLG
jgi:hypothetical protein